MHQLRTILTNDDIKSIELEILVAFSDFCDRNQLNYSLAYGTLLGAARHKGFIPWDDDIDVVMPRPDYQKFIELAKAELFSQKFKVISTDTTGYLPTFAKVVDPTAIVKSGRNARSYEENVWIDVFPIDGIPSNPNKVRLLYLRSKVLTTLCVASKLNWRYKSTPLMQIAIFFSSPLAKLFPIEKWASRQLFKLSTRLPYADSDTVGLIGWGGGPQEAMSREWLEDRIDLQFENHSFKAPREYPKILSQMYGRNYMELPPIEMRVTHQLEGYRLH